MAPPAFTDNHDQETEDAFRDALDVFKKKCSGRNLERFQEMSNLELKCEIIHIQQDQERLKAMLNLRRMQKFIFRLEELQVVLADFLDAGRYLSYIWGAMKFLLSMARSTLPDGFDGLLDAYERLGRKMPKLQNLDDLFTKHTGMRKCLSGLYKDILEFHAGAYQCFTQFPERGRKKILKAAWKDFNHTITHLEDNLQTHKVLVEQGERLLNHNRSLGKEGGLGPDDTWKLSEAVARYQTEGIQRAREIRTAESKRHLEQFQEALNWISAGQDASEDTHAERCDVRREYPETCDWIKKSDAVDNWMSVATPTHSVLWINGPMGAGKSTLASYLVEQCKEGTSAGAPFKTIYFYCRGKVPESSTCLAMFKGLLHQQLIHIRDNEKFWHLVAYCYDKKDGSGQQRLKTDDVARSLLDLFFDIIPHQYMIIDGLDECEKPEIRQSLSLLTSVVERQDNTEPGRLRLLIVSRDTPEIRRPLSGEKITASIVKIEAKDNEEAISKYVAQRLTQFPPGLHLTNEDKDRIRDLTCNKAKGAQGMFLFAELVLNNLQRVIQKEALMKELDVRRFPMTLGQAYDRIIDGIRKNQDDERWEKTKAIFGWLICAGRILRWHEIQAIVSIERHDQSVEFQQKKFIPDVQELCGTLVHIKPGNKVELIHHTAHEYILKSQFVNKVEVQFDLATLCMQYLTFPCFERGITFSLRKDFAKDGFYAFQDYAVSRWFYHIAEVVRISGHLLSIDLEKSQKFADILDNFTNRYQESIVDQQSSQSEEPESPASGRIDIKEIEENAKKECESLKDAPFYPMLLNLWIHISKHEKENIDDRNKPSLKEMENTLTENRTVLEGLLDNVKGGVEAEQLIEYYGKNIFKCPRTRCDYFYEGFEEEKKRDHHINRHDRPFECTVPGCGIAAAGFISNKDLERHKKNYHMGLVEGPAAFPQLSKKKNNDARFDSMSSSAPGGAANGKPPKTPEDQEHDDQNTTQDPGSQDDPSSGPASPPKPGIMARLGLDKPTLLMMLKGACAPTIAIAILQSEEVAGYFTTLGYLVGIMSILSLSILPRGKFLQTLMLNVIFACIGAAVALLIMWSALQARLHTESRPLDPSTGLPPYNSSQSAVSAVWLFFVIWFANTIRAKNPSMNVPVIVFSIFCNISSTYSPIMTSNAAFIGLVKRLLTAMLTAFGIAFACSLFILPVPSRKVSFAQMQGLVMLLRSAVKQEKAYIQSLEREDMFAIPHDVSSAVEEEGKTPKKSEKNAEPATAAEAKALKGTIGKVRELAGKVQADLVFAKRDVAWGKHGASDLRDIMLKIRACLIPVVGISTLIDIFQRVAEKRHWVTDDQTPADVLAEKNEEKRIWNEIMKQLHEPFETLAQIVDQGLEHAGMQLEMLPISKAAKKGGKDKPNGTIDVEAKGDLSTPGDVDFAKSLDDKVNTIKDVKGEVLKIWAKERGLLTEVEDPGTMRPEYLEGEFDEKHRRDQSQLFLLLYIEKLMQETSEAVQSFVTYADERVASGSMAKSHLIIPKWKKLKKWVTGLLKDEDASSENTADLFDSNNVVYVGDGFAAKKDPEHLPATNAIQHIGNALRAVNKFFGSQQSFFGMRVACATMTIGIVNFLEPTQAFFVKQRLVWAMIMVSISMTETSGQSIFGFLCRVGGTCVAMVLSLVAWYIVDEKVPGIIVFYALFIFMLHYGFLKYPQFIPAWMISMVTLTMIIGYQLQVRKIGIAVSESNNQPFYPIYEFGPYRLATVAGGCFVAFIFTIFPSPITDRTWLRRDLSATMYLLAHYFTAINESLKTRLRNNGGDPNVKSSPAYKLAKTRRHLFGKLLLILPSLSQHANFQRFEPDIGGKFPREIYLDIIQRATRISSYLTLISHSVTWEPHPTQQDRAWIQALSELLADVSSTKDTLICSLALLSNSLQNGHPLPPHIPMPRPYELTRQLEKIQAHGTPGSRSTSLLDARNMSENGFAEFAVLQVCSNLVCDDIKGLVKSVGKLVGSVDFSFRIEGSVGSLGSGSSTAAGTDSDADGKGKGKRD
ncbi:hypothetical protein SCAR479_13013 [Seiridium cardinale]|uniref:NACHT domain-containing protein n=1 Tax=Seiridium cardinale TaxID=138064 RepID=A0ABR2X9C8_9PEZI